MPRTWLLIAHGHLVYLRGLQAILRYVQEGGDLFPLLVGKMAAEYIPIIEELQYRKVLQPTPVTPRYLSDSTALERLAGLNGSTASVVDLVDCTSAEQGGIR